jgi:hypothetical protein
MADISDLEAQYELESEDDSELDSEADEEAYDDSELGDDHEADDELDQSQSYAERFHELTVREHESDEELETGLRDILGEMEQQYFLGGFLKKKLGKLAGAGARFAQRHLKKLPIGGVLKAAQGMLGKSLTDQLMRAASSLVPGGAVALPMLQSLGVVPGGASASAGDAAAESETWERFSEFAREVYETAADQTSELSLDPLKAIQQANRVIQGVAQQNKGAVQQTFNAVRRHGGRRVVRVRPGESVLIVCK